MRKVYILVSVVWNAAASSFSGPDVDEEEEFYDCSEGECTEAFPGCQVLSDIPLEIPTCALEPVMRKTIEVPIRVRLIFVQSAESVWKEAAHASSLTVKARAHYGRMFGEYDDPGLSSRGAWEAGRLAQAIESNESSNDVDWDALRNKQPQNAIRIFATSNLKRAAMTLLIALRGQLEALRQAGVHVLSSLQETSSKRDARSSSQAWEAPDLDQCPYKPGSLTNLFRPECNLGDHGERTVPEKLDAFCNWMHRQVLETLNNESSKDGPIYFVVAGHRSWIISFFQSQFVNYIDNGSSGIEIRLLQGMHLHNTDTIATTLQLGAKMDMRCRIITGSTRQLYTSIQSEHERDWIEKRNAYNDKCSATSVGEYRKKYSAPVGKVRVDSTGTDSTASESITSDEDTYMN